MHAYLINVNNVLQYPNAWLYPTFTFWFIPILIFLESRLLRAATERERANGNGGEIPWNIAHNTPQHSADGNAAIQMANATTFGTTVNVPPTYAEVDDGRKASGSESGYMDVGPIGPAEDHDGDMSF